MRKVSALLLASLILCGCTSGNSNQAGAIEVGDYSAILPTGSTATRGKHVGLISDQDIRSAMEVGLMDLSKAYFNPIEVGYTTYAYLDFDELDATDESRGLLGAVRDSNPNGLNPASDKAFDTGNGHVTGPTLVLDLYELDFYSNDQLAGISIALVVPDAVGKDNVKTRITPEKMKDYLDETTARLVSYMRERFNDINSRVPILVAAYQLSSDEKDGMNGGYIYSVYFNGPDTDYKTIDEVHYVVPSEKFSATDPAMAKEFDTFRSNIKTVLPDATFVTGDAKYEDGVCSRMVLNIVCHGKTAGEVLAVIQSVVDQMSDFTSDQTDFRITINNDNETAAILRRPKGSMTVDVISSL